MRREKLLPIFTLDRELIQQKNAIRYLGDQIDNQLKWKDHVSQVSSEVVRAIGYIKYARKLLPRETLRMLYLSLLSTRRNFSCELIFSIEICSGHAQFCTNYFAHTAFSSHKKLNHLQLLANFARSSACMASRSNMKLGKQLRFTRTEATLLLQIAF